MKKSRSYVLGVRVLRNHQTELRFHFISELSFQLELSFSIPLTQSKALVGSTLPEENSYIGKLLFVFLASMIREDLERFLLVVE